MVLKRFLGKFQDFVCPFRLMVRTLPFQGIHVGSIPIKGNFEIRFLIVKILAYMENLNYLKICHFLVFHEERVFLLTGQFLNSKKCFFPDTVANKRFRIRNINLKLYSEVFDSSTRADAFFKKMQQSLSSEEIYINKWVISIEKQINPLDGLLSFKAFGRLLLSKPLITCRRDFFSSEGCTVEYINVDNTSFEETLWSLATKQENYNCLDSGAVFACNNLSGWIKVELVWRRSINLFIMGELQRLGIEIKGSQENFLYFVKLRAVRSAFSFLCKEAGYNLDKWLSQKNPLHTHKGSNDSENQSLIYLLYIENNGQLFFLRNIIYELKKLLQELDS
jgi:hypothetical protein